MIGRAWVPVAVAAACASVLAGAYGWGRADGAALAQARHAAELRAAQDMAAARERALVQGVEQLAEEVVAREQEMRDRAGGADLALERLRAEIGRADAAATDTGAAAAADAARARALLAECATAHRQLAGEADSIRARLIGLQDYVRRACVSGPSAP